MNNNPGEITDMSLRKLFFFIFLFRICFLKKKKKLRHDYLLADEVISHKKIKSVKCF